MLVRIYTGDDGQSHFEDLGLPEPDVHRIATKHGEDLVFRRSAADRPAEWHLFLGSQWLAAAGSIGAALLFWWTWHRLETKRSGDPVSTR